jgi:uncharacterized protein YceH (UPF0502 family)
MNPPLTDVEVRILGSLLEKEVTIPDNYPLSPNALLAACNQISNREPVMQLDEGTLTEAVVALRRRGLLRAIQPAGSRVTKYQHLLGESLDLDARQLALLGVLMLRGAQTVGELHARTIRLAEFADLADVEATLESLIARQPESLVARMPRRTGQKELRYAHLLSGDPVVAEAEARTPEGLPSRLGDDARIDELERAVESLRVELAALRAELADFRSQFQ